MTCASPTASGRKPGDAGRCCHRDRRRQNRRMAREMPERYGADDAQAGLGAAEGRAGLDAVPDPHAVPGLDASTSPNGSFVFDVDVDGELFAVFEVDAGHWNYEWLTGPKPYGFGAGGPPVDGVDEHLDRIRLFLRDIDPATGYLRED